MQVYTDGASSNNQVAEKREGGFAFVLPLPEPRVYYKYERGETNNRMELKGWLYALREILSLDLPVREIELNTDSKYLIGCFSGNKIKKNSDIIFEVMDLVRDNGFRIEYNYVAGHSGDRYNEVCDTYARMAIERKNTELMSEAVT